MTFRLNGWSFGMVTSGPTGMWRQASREVNGKPGSDASPGFPDQLNGGEVIAAPITEPTLSR